VRRFAQFFEETNGRLSSKRLAGLAAATTLNVAMLAQTAAAVVIAWRHPELPAVPLDGTLMVTVGGVALGGLGLSSWEKHITEKEATRRATGAVRAVPEER